MRKFMPPAALATALGFAFLPAAVQASWLSEALHRGDNDGRDVRYLPPPPQYPYTARYAPPAYPAYPAPVVPAPVVLPPVVTPPVAPVAPVSPTRCDMDRVAAIIDRMAEKLETLREDVAVEVPGPRGRALAAQAADMDEQAEHLQKSVRGGASPQHLLEHAAELDHSFHEFLEAAEGLGEDGEYLSRSAHRIEDLDHALMRLLSPAGVRDGDER